MTAAPDLAERFNIAIADAFPDGDISVNEVAAAAMAVLGVYVRNASLAHRANLHRMVSAQLRAYWGLEAPPPAADEVRAFPDYLVPIETNDCNATLKNGDGGVRDLPVFEWGDRFIRVAYVVPKALRRKLRDRAVVTVVVKEGPGGVESMSAKVQDIELTTEH